jgi:hypothetical protein
MDWKWKKKGTFYNYDTKDHFARKCREKKKRLKEQMQRFFISSHNKQN